MFALGYSDIILTGIFFTSIFWVIRTLRKDRKRRKDENPTVVSNA
jgi:hypothetical protein